MHLRISGSGAVGTLALLALTMGLSSFASAQDATVNKGAGCGVTCTQNTPTNVVERNLFRSDVDLVLVPVIVTNELNEPVTNLRKEDFRIYDNGVPQEISYFAQEDTPLSIGILLDTSGSMTSKFDIATQALNQFFKEANEKDDYFIVTYSTRPTLWANVNESIDSLEQSVSNIRPDGSTALLDGIYLGFSKVKMGRYDRRALLIISDGGDNNSRYCAREIRELAKESDVQVFAMAVFGRLTLTYEDWSGKRLLSEIAEATGGRAAIVSRWTSLPKVASEISHALRAQYLIAYKPTTGRHNAKMHKITVKTSSSSHQGRVQLYYRRQYFASRE